MAGAGGTEVGRINVRVVPDLDEFYQKLERAVKKYDNSTVTIKVDADVSQFLSKVKAAKESLDGTDIDVGAKTAGLRDEVRAATEGLDATVDVDADTDDAERSIDRFKNRYLNKFNRLIGEVEANIPLTVDGEAIRREIKSQEREFKELLKEITPKLDPQTLSDLRRDVDVFYRYVYNRSRDAELLNLDNAGRVKRAMKSIQDFINMDTTTLLLYESFDKELKRVQAESEKTFADLDATLDIRVEDGEVKRLRQKLSERIIVPVSLQEDYNNDRILRGFAIAGAGIKQGVTSAVDTAVEGVGKLGKALSRFSPESLIQGLAIVAAVVALLAPALSLLTGSLVALPGVLAAVAIPMGVIALGLDGIKKAAETAKPAFDELRAAISATFEEGLKPGFELIRDRLLPGIQLPLQGVAQSLSSAFNGVLDTLTSGEGLNNLQRTIDNVAAGIKSATPGLQAFTDGLNQLVASLSKGFPGAGEAFTRLGESFSGWIDKITANGELETAMSNLKGTLGEISGLVGDIAKWSWDNLADPAFGAKMKEFAADLRAIVNDLLPLLKSGFEDIATVISGIGDTIKAIKDAGNAFESFFGRDKNVTNPKRLAEQEKLWGNLSKFGINDDANIVKWLGLQRGKAGEAAAEVGTEAGKKFQESLTQAAADASAGGASLTDAINKQLASGVDVNNQLQEQALRSAFTGTGVTDAVASQIETQMGAVISRAQAAVKELGPTLQADIDAALQPLQDIPAKMMPAFEGIGAAVGGAWGAITAFIRTATAEIGDVIAQEFMAIPTKLMGAFGMLGAAVGGAMAGLRGVIASNLGGITDAFGQAFAGVAGRVSSMLSAVPGAVAAALSPTIGVVQQVMLGVINVISVSAQQIIGLASTAFSQFAPVVQAAMAPAITAVSTICQQMVDTAMSYASVMENAGRAIGSSFAAGLASTSGLVASAASSLMAAAREFIPSSPAKKGPFSGSGWVDNSGESVGEAFAAGMNKSMPGVVSTARELMQAVKDIFGTAEGLTLNFNMGPVTQQLGQVAAATQTFQDTLATTAKTATGFQDSISTVVPSGEVDLSRKTELDQSMRQLEMERKALEIQKAQGVGDQAAIKARLEEIRLQKLQIGLQQNQLTYAEKYGAAAGGTAEHYSDLMKKAQDLPTDFAKATGQQFMQDLGMSGNGMIPSLLEQGTQYIFQVANMDTAMSAHQTLQRKQALGLVGR